MLVRVEVLIALVYVQTHHPVRIATRNSTDRMPAQSLPTRQLGKDGPQVTAIGFGLMYVVRHVK
jgi:hypothetical protein